MVKKEAKSRERKLFVKHRANGVANKCMEDQKCVENAENGWISDFMGISVSNPTMKLY